MATKTADAVQEERATRALERRQGRGTVLSALDQMRPSNVQGTPDKSAGAYYLRPEGATIADALIYYPNGAQLSREDDPKGRYSENASYYQERQRRKGFEYVGPTLTIAGAKRLVEILEANQGEEVERLEDEIALCEQTVKNTDRPDVRDHERRRKGQLQARLDRVRTPLDPDALVKQLEDIARAQRMASMPPQVLQVMREMLAEQGKSIRDDLIARFTKDAGDGQDHTPEGVAVID